MASAILSGAGSLVKKAFGKKDKSNDDSNQATTGISAPTADDTLARIEAERRLRKEQGDGGRAGSILSRGTLG